MSIRQTVTFFIFLIGPFSLNAQSISLSRQVIGSYGSSHTLSNILQSYIKDNISGFTVTIKGIPDSTFVLSGGGTTTITGAVSLGSTLDVAGNASVSGNLNIGGTATIASNPISAIR